VKVLSLLGHEAVAVSTVAEALVQLKETKPDCLILDLILPDDNGLTVLRSLRNEGLPIKVAVVTAIQGARELNEVKRLAPDAIFQKPIDVMSLAGWLMTSET
jgi:CheY-like chemotaxis protein